MKHYLHTSTYAMHEFYVSYKTAKRVMTRGKKRVPQYRISQLAMAIGTLRGFWCCGIITYEIFNRYLEIYHSLYFKILRYNSNFNA